MKNNKQQETPMPDYLKRSMQNASELLCHLPISGNTTPSESQEDRGWNIDITDPTPTPFGILLKLTNSDNKRFQILVSPEDFSDFNNLSVD